MPEMLCPCSFRPIPLFHSSWTGELSPTVPSQQLTTLLLLDQTAFTTSTAATTTTSTITTTWVYTSLLGKKLVHKREKSSSSSPSLPSILFQGRGSFFPWFWPQPGVSFYSYMLRLLLLLLLLLLLRFHSVSIMHNLRRKKRRVTWAKNDQNNGKGIIMLKWIYLSMTKHHSQPTRDSNQRRQLQTGSLGSFLTPLDNGTSF